MGGADLWGETLARRGAEGYIFEAKVGAQGLAALGVGGAIVGRQRAERPPHVLENLLKEFEPRTFRAGVATIRLDRSGMKSIIERHHPEYYRSDGKEQGGQSYFDKSLSKDDVANIGVFGLSSIAMRLLQTATIFLNRIISVPRT
jgi:hypothetical protein